jgi:hypothetical protein
MVKNVTLGLPRLLSRYSLLALAELPGQQRGDGEV